MGFVMNDHDIEQKIVNVAAETLKMDITKITAESIY